MKHVFAVSSLALCTLAFIAGCSKPATEADAAAAPPEAPAAPAAPPEAPAAPVAAADPTPSFDCAKAESEAETLVCSTPSLAALDRRLAEVYAAAKAKKPDSTVVAEQRGWVKGRDECWKADDKPRCVEEEYKTRIVQLLIDTGDAVAPTPVEYACDDKSVRFAVAYWNDLDPQAAVVTYNNDQAIAFPVKSASGARYGRVGVDVWEHQGEVKVDFFGIKLTCKVP